MRALLLLALVLCTAAGPGSAQSPASSSPAVAASVLRPGDAVLVTVWRRDDLSGEFAVAADGSIVHPILRQVVVTGLPFVEVERRIAALLSTFEGETDFVVQPLIRVGVGGEVRQPNLYLLTLDMTVSDAVSRAGGPTERGRTDRVILLREGVTHELDLVDPAGRAAQIRVQSGDQITVGRRRDILREYIMPVSSIVAAVAALVRVTR